MSLLNLLSIFVILILFLAGTLHFYWSFGGKYLLERAIPTLNNKPIISPSNFLTFCVGLLLLGFSLIVYLIEFYDLSSLIGAKQILYFCLFLSLLFLIRAVGDFRFVGAFKKFKSSKFAEYDTLYYSPLFLFLSFYFVFISYKMCL